MIDDIAKQHERFGRIVTDIIAAYAATLDSRNVASDATPQSLAKLFDEPLPEKGIAAEEIFERYQAGCDYARNAGPQPSILWSIQPNASSDWRLG